MRQLLRHTTILLRTILLFGGLLLWGTIKAQPVSLTKDMPDAFDTKTPVIGDGQYYFIQFYEEVTSSPYLFQSFLGEFGEGNIMHACDYVPYSQNRQWTLVQGSASGQFKLMSKDGFYAVWGHHTDTQHPTLDKDCFMGTKTQTPTEFVLTPKTNLREGFTYYELKIAGENNCMSRELGDEYNREWADMVKNSSGTDYNYVRFATLKPNAAHIIYYREEHADGRDNMQYRANETTTRHYLTYSGTGNETPASPTNDATLVTSTVSSRRSVVPSDKSLWTLPTSASYHQDGLWALEEAGDNGEFYIKKYGTEEYLKQNDAHVSILGTKDPLNGKYKTQDPSANRYTPIQTIQYTTQSLASSMFNTTEGITFNVGNNTSFGGGALVVGTGEVNYQKYADLGGNTKMVVNGTPGIPLRVLMSRQESNSGPLVEKTATIGSDGKAVVDLTNLELNHATGQATVRMTYVNGSDGSSYEPSNGDPYTIPDNRNVSYGEISAGNPAYCGFNRISSNGTVTLGNMGWNVNNLAFLQVDVSALLGTKGTIRRVTLKGDFQQITDREMEYGVGYNNSTWSSAMTWNTADRSITTLGATKRVGRASVDSVLTFDITDAFRDGKVKTILVYNLAAGGGYMKNPRVDVEYSPNEPVSYAHLNAIKTGYGGATGTISSIELVNENSVASSGIRYLHHSKGDGWQVPQWETQWSDLWHAAFYPVEVPVPNKDNFFQVLVGLRSSIGDQGLPTQMVRYDGWADPYDETNPILWQLEQIDDYEHFRLKRPDTGEYLAGQGKMTEPNDPNGQSYEGANVAEVYTNEKFFNDFTLKWFLQTNTIEKEIVVDHYVRHRESFLRTYADKNVITDQKGLKRQGLSTDIDSEWKNFDDNLEGFTQKVNLFEITHYVKKGNSRVIEFPTVLNHNNDHIFFQRFYNYDERDTDMDLEKLKAHVSLDTRDDGDVQYFLYNNGMVTGQRLNWTTYNNGTYKAIPDGGMARNEQRRFNFTNSDGQRFAVGVDVSRYSDMEYLSSPDHLAGDLKEPSLTMRYIFHMRDAKEMAANLTACPEGGDKWLEAKEFHFGRTQVPYTKFKKVGYRGEFLPIRHIFSDYWVYDDPEFIKKDGSGKPMANDKGDAIIDTTYITNKYGTMTNEQLGNFLDEHLVSAVNSNRDGKIEVEIDDPNEVGIRLGGYNPNINLNSEDASDGNDADYQGFYMYDLLSPSPKYDYGNSRFTVFRYPSDGKIGDDKVGKPVYLNVYVNNGDQRYQLAQYTLIFDANMATRPWTTIKNGTHYANGVDSVKNTKRDPKELRKMAGLPIAKVSFDFPKKMVIGGDSVDATYHFPKQGETRHNNGRGSFTPTEANNYTGTIANSSPVPLTFGHTNYSFDGDYCNWGSYALVTTMETHYGNQKTIMPADDATYGYNLPADSGMQKAFLYIDASEQPGDICAMEFEGEFCPNDQLMCSGWISGSNKIQGDTRCPGSITLTVKGEDKNGKTNTIYRFCPGQIYELDNGYELPGATETNVKDSIGNAGIDGNGNKATHVVWQQFYFEFSTDQKYERYWLEVNNNCVSSNGGDFMLDNVEVYTIVPEVIPDINTPLCVQRDGTADMKLLKLKVDYNKLLSSVIKKESTSSETATNTPYLGLVFLEKDKFLTTLREELGETNVSLSQMAERVEMGYYDNELDGSDTRFQNAFNTALLRTGNSTKIWHSDDNPITQNTGAGILYFKWHKTFATDNIQPVYTFANAVNKTSSVYRATEDGVDYLILNGNFPQLPWKTNTEYYIVPSNTVITNFEDVYNAFNICSNCSKASTFELEPPYKILSMEAPDITDDYAFCEGKTPTLLVDLKGYTSGGVETLLKNLNYDWWLGSENKTATLTNYHNETNEAGTVKLDDALYAFRNYYPSVTSVDGATEKLAKKPYLTREMIYYLQELVNKGELVLHQKSISILAEKNSADYPYFYLVACPILDADFYNAVDSVPSTYYCEAPQGLRMKVGEKAPSLKTGFVPNENGLFDAYHYPAANTVLSVRLAKKAQFETVKHGAASDPTEKWENSSNRFLWLPLRDAKVQSGKSTYVIQKADDDNIYLASTDDPTWDQAIYTAMNAVDAQNKPIGALPVVGKIEQLNAIDTSKEENNTLTERNKNRLCVYFTENFDVREGYNYTLSLPFKEAPGTNTCDGTILLHLKIVPDYEVWTGAAGNTDWNNDQNWRRADGNTDDPSNDTTDGSGLNNNELYVSTALPDTSKLYQYTSNYQNYRTPKDRLLRKGFAPLYCTHILLKSNEWGDDPVLYDAFNGESSLEASPFPNLSETYEVNTSQYAVDTRYETIDALGCDATAKAFAIFNEADGKMLYGTTAQNLAYGSGNVAMQLRNSAYVNSGFKFKLEQAQNVTGVSNSENMYYLHLLTPDEQPYTIWGSPGYLNSQLTTGVCSFILGLNSQNGQDLVNGAVWELVSNGNGKFALKNVGTGLYLKDAGPAKYDEPTYFTLCTLKEETVSTSSQVRTNILKYDIQAREYSIWKDTYGDNPDKGRAGDLIAEMYQINSCDEIAFQPTAELMNAHLLNYNNAWMEYQLDQNRWYLLGSALQGTIAGEWYAPTGDAQQNTTYYENVTFGEGYDRFSPAVYQRSWDKAKAVLYEVGSDYNTSDDSQTENLGSSLQGSWSGTSWSTTDADNYLDRLGYKPMTGGKKANVAIKGIWSNTYNDATVDYANGGFSVMVKNDLRGGSNAKPAIIRLPKEDKKYYYYEFGQTGANDGGTETYLINHNNVAGVQSAKGRALNRGRLKTDLLLPVIKDAQQNKIIQKREKAASRYGDVRTYTRVPIKEDSLIAMNNGTFSFNDTIPGGVSNLNYYLVANPFPCGLNMNKFFSDEANPGLAKKYWLLTAEGQHLVQRAEDSNEWITPDGGKYVASDSILPPGQGFFVQTTASGTSAIIKFDKEMQAQSRYGVKKGASQSYTIVVGSKKVGETVQEITNTVEVNSYTQDTNKKFPLRAPGTRASEATEEALPLGLVITAQRGDSQSSALVMVSDKASNDFLPTEDTETFLNSDLKQVPTVYTLCGRLATTINSIREFSYLPVGVESASEAPCTLTFRGVETLGDSIAFYDAVERTLTPLESGMQMTVSGQTQNRYYLVRTLSKEEAAEETHLQIFTEGLTAKVISSTSEPIVNVRCYDTAGRLVHAASPQTTEYSFHLPHAGIYIIDAQTDSDRKTKKLMTK